MNTRPFTTCGIIWVVVGFTIITVLVITKNPLCLSAFVVPVFATWFLCNCAKSCYTGDVQEKNAVAHFLGEGLKGRHHRDSAAYDEDVQYMFDYDESECFCGGAKDTSDDELYDEEDERG